jgi:hypothetical protein
LISGVRRVAQAGPGVPAGGEYPGGTGQVERDHRVRQPGGVGRVPAGQVGQRAVLEFGDDLLDDRVVTVLLVGLDDTEGAVGDERVVPVGGEQLTLPGWLEPFHPAHHQPALDVIACAAGAERGEAGLGDLGVARSSAAPARPRPRAGT